mmetsp:Transcript_10044/g.25677  ORF Transcript_10044/g.25677 Transcript_10044/m.25677 type:complete len:226 (+) Transcript_10044:548-1225(+)
MAPSCSSAASGARPPPFCPSRARQRWRCVSAPCFSSWRAPTRPSPAPPSNCRTAWSSRWPLPPASRCTARRTTPRWHSWACCTTPPSPTSPGPRTASRWSALPRTATAASPSLSRASWGSRWRRGCCRRISARRGRERRRRRTLAPRPRRRWRQGRLALRLLSASGRARRPGKRKLLLPSSLPRSLLRRAGLCPRRCSPGASRPRRQRGSRQRRCSLAASRQRRP